MHIACGPPSLQCGGEEGRIPGACTHMSAILSRGQRGSAECRAGVAQRCASPTTINGSTYLKPQPNSGALYLYLFQDFYVQLSKVVKPHTRRGPPLTDVDMLGGWGQWPPSSFPSFFSAGSHSHAKGKSWIHRIPIHLPAMSSSRSAALQGRLSKQGACARLHIPRA